jgi:photosystem II stability/assembly factor-like uncharacterized protein
MKSTRNQSLVFIFFVILSATTSGQEFLQMMESGTYSVQEIQISAEKYYENKDKGRGTGYKQYKRWEYNALRMADENGYLKSDEYYVRQWEKMNAELNANGVGFFRSNDYWTEMGPDYHVGTTGWNPGIGRITSFFIDPKNDKHIIAGAETGGVWKSLNAGQTWEPLLDNFSNIGVESVVMDPFNSNIYFFGSTSGRVYTTTDAGKTWTEKGRAGASKVRRILIHPNDSKIMFACSQGSGFYRSVNGGTSWTKITTDPQAYDIKFKPGDPKTVYASGSHFHISDDGGLTFETISKGEGYPNIITITAPASLAKGYDAIENTFSPGYVPIPEYPSFLSGKLVLYQDESGNTSDACGQPLNRSELNNNIAIIRRGMCPFAAKVLNAQNAGAVAVIIVNNVAGGPTAMGGSDGNITIPAIMVSQEDGNFLINSLTTQEMNATLQKSFFPENSLKIAPKVIGISPSSPSVVYVLEASQSKFGGLYKSNDSGRTFEKLTHDDKNYFGYSTNADDDRGQAPRNMDIAVHPQNANEVHIGGILTWMSMDGGKTFTCTSDWIPDRAATDNLGYCHADVTKMDFYGSSLFVTSDGGIFKATKTSTLNPDYYTDLTEGMGIRQFYKIGISQTDPVVITGGSQDNGTSWYSDFTGWQDWLGADGMETFVDNKNPLILYGTSQYGSLYRKNEFDNYSNLDTPENKEGNWVTPFEKDPIAPRTIYTGYDAVYKSTDEGESWTQISQIFAGKLNHMKIAPTNNKIMFASHESSLYKTTTGSGTWTKLSGFAGNINFIAIHPTNPQKVAIATTNTQKVYLSADGGATWTPFRKNLPDFSALSLVWQEGPEDGLYIGMNYGVFYIDNTMQNWIPYLNNLPNVIINELEINYAENKIYAATYGRGLWSSPVYGSIPDHTEDVADDTILISPNPASQFVQINGPSIGQLLTDIAVFNVSGQQVIAEKDVLVNGYTLSIQNLPVGQYFIRMSNVKGVFTKKLAIH